MVPDTPIVSLPHQTVRVVYISLNWHGVVLIINKGSNSNILFSIFVQVYRTNVASVVCLENINLHIQSVGISKLIIATKWARVNNSARHSFNKWTPFCNANEWR